MPSLSDRLKALGVKVGASELPPPPARNPHTIEAELDLQSLETPLGQAFVVRTRYPAGYQHGQSGLVGTRPQAALARWAGEERLQAMQAEEFAFIDTETTGLSGGTGTYAFLIGAGRFIAGAFELAQFFLRDPLEEPAQLIALEQFLAPCQALVSFNGKAFDLPLLKTRFISHGLRPSFDGAAHVDLLHLARRLWRDRLPSRTLGSLEVNILGTERSQEDVPGWMIPSLYFDYLRSGDARPLKGVFYHNAIDVVSLAALFNHTDALLGDPLAGALEHGADLVALGRLFEDLGETDLATRLYLQGVAHEDLPDRLLLEAIQRLAQIHKRQDRHDEAVRLWKVAAGHQHLAAHIELAKFYEHLARDPAEALYWTQSAINLVKSPGFPAHERRVHLPDLEHRRQRLVKKLDPGPH